MCFRSKINTGICFLIFFISGWSLLDFGFSQQVYRRRETLVVSHTCCRAAGKGDRLKWAIAVGDTADGARCGYVDTMAVSFPGTKFSEALVTRQDAVQLPSAAVAPAKKRSGSRLRSRSSMPRPDRSVVCEENLPLDLGIARGPYGACILGCPRFDMCAARNPPTADP